MDKIDPLDLVLLAAYASEEIIIGRTRIHKLIYLEQQKSGREDVEFRPYYYGPYSDELASSLVEAVEFGFLKESCYASNQDPNIIMYKYDLSEEGKNHVEKELLIDKDAQTVKEQISKIYDETGDLTCTKLSLMAKIIFVLRNREDKVPLTISEIVTKALTEYKWDIDQADLRSLIDPVLVDLDLVRRN